MRSFMTSAVAFAFIAMTSAVSVHAGANKDLTEIQPRQNLQNLLNVNNVEVQSVDMNIPFTVSDELLIDLTEAGIAIKTLRQQVRQEVALQRELARINP